MTKLDTDYLVIGAGATGLSFIDTLLDETDAHITVVDKRDKPGGHWNDAYPFVRLHQPSSYYGVASRNLGSARIDERGVNKGFEELASGADVSAYLHAVMQERFIPSGRVTFLPMSEYVGDGDVCNMLSGARTHINIRGRLVDASICENGIPLTHKRKFDVAEGVSCIPPNFLPRLAAGHEHFTVLGAGKTAMDVIVWLIDNGADGSQIRWIVPRDPWIINRAFTQPSGAFYHESFGGTANQMEAARDASSVDDFARRMEAAGLWMRLDPDVWPQMIHGPTMSKIELDYLRQVADIVRMGHVVGIEPDAMIMAEGKIPARPDSLYVDCTARALGHTNTWPIFTEERIGLQMVRLFQPTFSSAILAKIESMGGDDKAKNALAAPVPMTDDVQSWIRSQIANSMNQFAWSQVPELKNWIADCRLDGFGRASREVDRDDPAVKEIYQRIRSAMMPAFANMQRLAAA